MHRDAKGRKVSGNFGNFPWKVSGILKGWEFSEILGIFNFDLVSTFMRLFAQISTKLNLPCTIFKHTCSALLFRQFIGLCGSKERTTQLYYEISLDLICLVFIKLNILCFSTMFLEFQKKSRLKKKNILFKFYS